MSTADPSRSFDTPVTGSSSGPTQAIPTSAEDSAKGGSVQKGSPAAAQKSGAKSVQQSGAKPAAKPSAKSGQASAAKSAPAAASSGRKVRLTLARIDPWSALKMSLLLSVALGVALVVAVTVLWLILSAMGVFDEVNSLVGKIIQDSGKPFDVMDYIGLGRVVSLAIVIAVIDVFLWTAIATIGSFIYNVSSSLVGGLHLTLTDD